MKQTSSGGLPWYSVMSSIRAQSSVMTTSSIWAERLYRWRRCISGYARSWAEIFGGLMYCAPVPSGQSLDQLTHYYPRSV